MPRLSLPARSLRGQSASLRLFRERTRYSICKGLIWHALLVVGRTISGIESFFLPALREPLEPSERKVSASSGNRDSSAIRPTGPANGRGASRGCSPGPLVRRLAPSRAMPSSPSPGSALPATTAPPDTRKLQRRAAFLASARDAPRLCRSAIKRGLISLCRGEEGYARVCSQRRPNRRSMSARSSAT
jgi:hypothetical protein